MIAAQLRLVALVFTAALLAACARTDDTAQATGQAGQHAISDAVHDHGVAGFVWLPPVVPRPALRGDIVPAADPTVRVDEVDAARPSRVIRTVATYTTRGGTDGERVRAHRAGGAPDDGDADPTGYFVVRFRTRHRDLSPSSLYRVRVLTPGGRELGFADIDVVRSHRAAHAVDRRAFVPLIEDATLRIKFRVDRPAVDADADGAFDWADNCPAVANPDQRDGDRDGLGDACECAAGFADCDGVAANGCETAGVGAACEVGTGACAARGVTVCGAAGGTRCDATPRAAGVEACNGIDDDCDGAVDEGLGVVSCGTGACARTVDACVGGVAQTCTPGAPASETCNGADDDCDGFVDEDIAPRACYTGPAGTAGVGACAAGTQSCTAGAWGACAGEVVPRVEACDGADDDCDGAVDDVAPTACAGGAVCSAGRCTSTLGCASGPRRGFTDAASYPTIAACGSATDYPGAVAAAPAVCAAGWHMCTPAEVGALAGPTPDLEGPDGTVAWVDYTAPDTSAYEQFDDLTCSGRASGATNLAGTAGCTTAGGHPEGWRLAISPAAWGFAHATRAGCMPRLAHACGFPGGAVPPARGYAACCRDALGPAIPAAAPLATEPAVPVATIAGPTEIAVAPSGVLYVSATDRGAIYRVDPTVNPTRIETLTAGLEGPAAIAFDATGTGLLVAERHRGRVVRIPLAAPSERQVVAAPAGLSEPWGLARDGTNNLIVSDAASSRLFRIAPAGTVTTATIALTAPRGLVLDASNQPFVVEFGGGAGTRVGQYSAALGLVRTYTGFNGASGIARDGANNLFVANYASDLPGAGTVVRVTPGGVVATFAAGLTGPQGLAFEPTGGLYVAEAGAGRIVRVGGGPACTTGARDCDGNLANGCERDVTGDAANCGACGRACAAGQVCAGGACVESVALGFSASANPANGWTFGHTATAMRGSAFAPYDSPFVEPASGAEFWTSAALGVEPNVARNGASSAVTYAGALVPAGTVTLHPGPSGENSVARWTAARPGSYWIDATFTGRVGAAGTTTDVAVRHDATELFAAGINVGGGGNTATYSAFRAVGAGQAVSFFVGYGDGAFVGDTTGLDARLVPVTADEFVGAALGANWDPTAIGAAPTYSVTGGWLEIANAEPAVTPSSPGNSWIYDYNRDRGNQMAWAHPVGTRDFDASVTFDWSSANRNELAIAGVALTDATGLIEVFAGYQDGDASVFGGPYARVRETSLAWSGAVAGAGAGTFALSRRGTTLVVAYNGVAVLTSRLSASVAHLAVVTVRHRSGTLLYPFTPVGFDRVALRY